MVPETFTNYFSARANAGAALAGHLFLAVTLGPIPTVGPRAPVERRSVATSAFVALINAFLLSLLALLPGGNYGIVESRSVWARLSPRCALDASLSNVNMWHWSFVRRLVLVAVSAVIYGTEAWQGLQLLGRPNETAQVSAIASLLLPVYTIGVLRAW